MVDMAVAWRRAGAHTMFVAPRPGLPLASAGGRPTVCDLLEHVPTGDRPVLVTCDADARFEFGTERYRAHTYADIVRRSVPAGVPIIVSDDAAVWAAAASMSARNPFIGVLHSDAQNYYALAVNYAASAGALVCVSARIERTLRQQLHAMNVKVMSVACGTALPSARRRTARAQFLRLVWVGRLVEPQKRVSDLPKIADGLRASGTPFRLEVVGDGPDKGATENAMRKAGLHEYVRFHGWLDAEAVHAAMSAADVLLLPSNFEGMPVVVMAALAVGCGVVASRVSGIEDLEHHPLADDCLLVHDVGDVDTAVRHARRLWQSDPAQRAHAARSLAESELSVEVCVRRYALIVAHASRASNLPNVPIGNAALSRFASLAVSTQRRARVWMRQRLITRSLARAR